MSHKKSCEDLRWIRLMSPIHIPKYLVEQIAYRDYDVDDFYKYLECNLVRENPNGNVLNPFFHVHSLIDKENVVRGFVWFTVDPLTKDIAIQTFSVDSNYWGAGEIVKKLEEYIKTVRSKAKLNKIFWITRTPKHSQKYGFKPSKNVLMEYQEELYGENINGEHSTDGHSRFVDSTTKKLSK